MCVCVCVCACVCVCTCLFVYTCGVLHVQWVRFFLRKMWEGSFVRGRNLVCGQYCSLNMRLRGPHGLVVGLALRCVTCYVESGFCAQRAAELKMRLCMPRRSAFDLVFLRSGVQRTNSTSVYTYMYAHMHIHIHIY